MKKFMSKWLRWIIALLLLVVALVCAGIWVEHQPTMSPVKQFSKQLTTTSDNNSLSKGQRDKLAQAVMKDDQKGANLNKQGFVAMPSLSILMPVYDNAYSLAALDLGANTANKGTPVPTMGEGNYTLAAHNWDNGYTGFSAMQQHINQDAPYLVDGKMGGSDWLNGKQIYLANAKGIYTYTVKNQTTVDQNDVSVLDVDARLNNKAKLTIITCLFPNTDYRIITNAQYTDFDSWQSAPSKLVSQFDTSKHKTNITP